MRSLASVPAAALVVLLLPSAISGRELLTGKEIEQLRLYRELDKRVEIYLKAADLRLDTLRQRLAGQESKEGDPLEFQSTLDLLEGYISAMRSIMANIDEAVGYKKEFGRELVKALEKLKESSEKYQPRLEEILKEAAKRKDQQLYRQAERAIELTRGAAEGASIGLERWGKGNR